MKYVNVGRTGLEILWLCEALDVAVKRDGLAPWREIRLGRT
jgi:hypothetical protein